jgi:hypothetical protein
MYILLAILQSLDFLLQFQHLLPFIIMVIWAVYWPHPPSEYIHKLESPEEPWQTTKPKENHHERIRVRKDLE